MLDWLANKIQGPSFLHLLPVLGLQDHASMPGVFTCMLTLSETMESIPSDHKLYKQKLT